VAGYRVIQYPNPILNTKCSSIVDKTIRLCLASALKETLYSSTIAVGVAAPQVGALSRVIVVDPDVSFDRLQTDSFRTMFDPVMQPFDGQLSFGQESCLSFPGLVANVPRFEEIVVDYTDLSGEQRSEFFTGWSARVIQHEIDHLNGVTILDKVPRNIRRIYERSIRYETLAV